MFSGSITRTGCLPKVILPECRNKPIWKPPIARKFKAAQPPWLILQIAGAARGNRSSPTRGFRPRRGHAGRIITSWWSIFPCTAWDSAPMRSSIRRRCTGWFWMPAGFAPAPASASQPAARPATVPMSAARNSFDFFVSRSAPADVAARLLQHPRVHFLIFTRQRFGIQIVQNPLAAALAPSR
jgi:hypothetical protein